MKKTPVFKNTETTSERIRSLTSRISEMLLKALFRFLLSMEPSCIDGTTSLIGKGYFFWKLEKCKKLFFLHHSKLVDVIS